MYISPMSKSFFSRLFRACCLRMKLKVKRAYDAVTSDVALACIDLLVVMIAYTHTRRYYSDGSAKQSPVAMVTAAVDKIGG